MTTTKEQIHEAREWLGAAVRGCSIGGRNEEMIRVLLAATTEHNAEVTRANAARLAAEHDRDEARAAEEYARQERDEARKRVREWEDLHEKEISGRLQEGRYVALQARAEHAEAELLNQMRERKAAEQWRDQLRARVAELEARLAGPTQEQRDNEADMLAFMVGG